MKDKIGVLGNDNQKVDVDVDDNPKVPNPSDYSQMSNNLGYNPDYTINYHNPYSFQDIAQDTYLTTVTPRIQRSFIPLRDTEWDSYTDASQIEPRVHYDEGYRSDDYYDYTMSRDNFEKMVLNHQYQYPYSQQARPQPRTYQNVMISNLKSWPPYSSHQVQGFSNPRAEQRSFNIEEAPEDGTWAGSRDWVATWVHKK